MSVDVTPSTDKGSPAPEKGREQLAETGSRDVTFGFGVAAGLMAIGAAGVVVARRSMN